ncbi:hypothetical protein [Avibacterium sp. 20-129]|uniref:hypothetical protein n=1 Tax=Avibacterium sp. 20-129 TaxID=2911525 RepID=UPI002246CE01|nr:hypothetical protein [Avibacterium sp. 20-129]MCW9699822.1 hypothetical protein [Avibacterium sp. 20-129]
MFKEKCIAVLTFLGAFCIAVLEFIALGESKTFSVFDYPINTRQIHFLSFLIWLYLTLLNRSILVKCLKKLWAKFS